MYFPMLNITTQSVWEKQKQNKNESDKNKKAYMPKVNNLFVSDTLTKLLTELFCPQSHTCNIAQLNQTSGILLIWAVHI